MFLYMIDNKNFRLMSVYILAKVHIMSIQLSMFVINAYNLNFICLITHDIKKNIIICVNV